MDLDSISKCYSFFNSKLGKSDVEELWIAALDSNCKIKSYTMLFRGTTDYCIFHPRDIFRFVIINNSVRYVLIHNHPSGDPLPSSNDFFNTKRIYELSILLQIELLDHIIIGDNNYYSFRKENIFSKWEKPALKRIKHHYLDGLDGNNS